jgi:multiple sugar transport system ATP-binding protein
MSTISFEQITKEFDGTRAVDALDLEIDHGEFLVLLGPSGCGKSTALRMLAGLETPTSGTISIGGEDVTDIEPRHRDVAMVFQSYALYPHMSVAKNIESPLVGRRSEHVTKTERTAMVERVATMLGLEDLLSRKPGQLSGGQRQRVALARAIVRRPAVFLMDEPLSNLDAKLRAQTRADIVDLHRELGATFVYVTHDQVEAMTMATRIAVLDEGRLQQVGTPREIYDEPANVFVARFVGSPSMNVLEATVDGRSATVAGGSIALPDGLDLAPGTTVTIGVRPEHLRVTAADEPAIEAHVTTTEWLGHEQVVTADIGGDAIAVRSVDSGALPAPGTALRLAVDPVHVHVFAHATGRRIEPPA